MAARKVVTALFCDLVGSTALGEELDPEALHGVLSRYFEEIRTTIERHGGTVQKFAGDAVMAVFGIPRVHEDDALRAVRAADEIRERLPRSRRRSACRCASAPESTLAWCSPARAEPRDRATPSTSPRGWSRRRGPARSCSAPRPCGLVRDAVEVEALEPLALKGKSEPVPAFRLLRLDPVAPGLSRAGSTSRSWAGSASCVSCGRPGSAPSTESGCHLFTLLGTAGVGKSRLVAELLARLGETATILRGRCLHYGEGITFWPLIEALGPLGEAQRNRSSSASRAAARRRPEELFWEVRRLPGVARGAPPGGPPRR